MRLSVLIVLVIALLWLTGVQAEVRPDTVVATVNGEELTAANVEALLAGAPTAVREAMRNNKRLFVQQYALVQLLASTAEEEGLGERSPYREKIEWSRMQVLLQAAIAHKSRSLRVAGMSSEEADKELRSWMDSLRDGTDVVFESEQYFSAELNEIESTPDETTVATVNGEPITAGDLKDFIRGGPANVRENFGKDRKQFLREYAMMLQLVNYATSEGLHEKSPYEEQINWVITDVLAQAKMNTYSDSISIGREEEQEYYAAHQDDYTEAKVKVIYIPFAPKAGTDAGGDEVLDEEQAKERAEKILAELEAGADFVEMVQQYSKDEASKAKDGDFAPIKQSDKIPAEIKDAIFGLEPGQVTAPIRQANGYYLFKVQEVNLLTIDDVRQTMNQKAKAAKFKIWFDKVRSSVDVTIENEDYFDSSDSE